jgi:hypothetical protein
MHRKKNRLKKQQSKNHRIDFYKGARLLSLAFFLIEIDV